MMKKEIFYVLLTLMMCVLASCQKDDNVEPEPQPEPQPVVIKYAEYETTADYVDLGIGNIMFATKNLGAKRPEDVGYFFAWGETAPKEVYSWDTYQLRTSPIYYGKDGVLLPDDDAATVMLGEGWRMPTADEAKLLSETYSPDELGCRSRGTVRNGVFGYEVTGPNGNSIFFPYSGYMREGELVNYDYTTRMWCSNYDKRSAMEIFSIDGLGVSLFEAMERCYGLLIRPVKEKKAASDTLFLKFNVLDRNIAEAQQLLATVNPAEYSAESYQSLNSKCQRAIAIRAYAVENDGQKTHQLTHYINEVNKELQDSIDMASQRLRLAIVGLDRLPTSADIKAVDLGLSVRWASRNLGARTDTENGYFYAWGEVAPKEGRYEWSTYTFCKGIGEGNFSKYITDSQWGEVDGKTRLDPEDDAAHVFMGGDWRMPTPDEFQELVDKCTFENVAMNGRTVMKATGPNGNCIYFPHTGTTSVIDEIYCWTADMSAGANQHAICYGIQSFFGEGYKSWEDRYVGMTVRAVCP